MDYLTLRKHIGELSQALEDKPLLARATDGPGRTFALRLKFKDRWSDLVVSLDSPNQGIRLADSCLETERGSSIVRTINRLLTNGRILSIALAGDEKKHSFDRVVKLHIAVVDSFFGQRTDYFLFCEFTGRIADVFICDAEFKIIDRMSRTSNNLISGNYRLPDSPPLLNPFTAEPAMLQKLFLAPEEEWKNMLGTFSPQMEAELKCRAEQSASPLAEIWQQLFHDSQTSAQTFVYFQQPTQKFKAISGFPLASMKTSEERRFATVNEAMNWIEENLVVARRFAELKKRALGSLQRELKIKKELLLDQQKLLLKYEDADHYQNQGNLLVANLYQIKAGCRSVELEDWQTQTNVVIELDPQKTPAANAQRLFNFYKKFRRGVAEVEKRMAALNDEIRWLSEQIWLTENASGEADINIEEKPEKAKKSGGKGKASPAKGRKGRPVDVKPALEIDECRYYVGRNAKQNDTLTFLLARRGDYWFHANDVPGAHVILKKAGGEITEVDLYRGALLAAWFSFARESSKVAVDSTEVSMVKKIPGGGAGRVSYTHQKTIMVNPAEAQKLLQANE